MEQRNNTAFLEIPTRIETCLQTETSIDHPIVIMYRNEKKRLNATHPPPQGIDYRWNGYGVKYTFHVKNSGSSRVDDLVAQISIIDEEMGLKFMCIDTIIVDSLPCKFEAGCSQYFKLLSRELDGQSRPRNTKLVNCKMNAIEVHRRATIVMETFYFPIMLLKLLEQKPGKSFIPFSHLTTSINIYHDNEMKSLYYQRASCSANGDVLLRFIDGGLGWNGSVEKVPLWIYAASVAGALLLLMGIVLLLIRLGFFERKDIDAIYLITLSEDDDQNEDES